MFSKFLLLDEQRRIVAYLVGLPPTLRFGDLRQAKVNALRGLQSQSQGELDALLPPPTGMISVLRPAGVGVSRSTMKTLRVSSVIGCHVRQGSLAYRDDCQPRKPLGLG